jgi:hypothetical protein
VSIKGELKMRQISFVLLCLTVFLLGCSERQDNKPPQQKKEPYYISGNIVIQTHYIIIKGKSDYLKPGAKLIVTAQDKQIGEMIIKKDGTFKLTTDNKPKFQLGDEILILFNPDLQSKKIQSIYGDKGQKLKGRFLYHYSKEGINYSGLKAGTYIDNLHIQIMDNVIQSAKILEKERQDFLDKQK